MIALRHVLPAAAILIAAPAFGMYKCVMGGHTSFQEQACPAGAVQTLIRAAQLNEEPLSQTTPPPRPTDEDRLADYERDRLRKDAEFALRDKVAQLASHQAYCERSAGVTFSRNATGTRSINGAVYVQTDSATVNAAAVRCIARINELQQEVGQLRQQCAVRRCE